MSNTNYKTKNQLTDEVVDLSTLFQSGNSGITTGYKTSTGADLGSIFAPLNGGTPILFDTNYKTSISPYSNVDLTNLFNPYQAYNITNASDVNVTFAQSNNKCGIVIEYTGNPSPWLTSGLPSVNPGRCNVTFNKDVNLSYIIIGGGAGGGQGAFGSGGNYGISGAVGGGGGGVIYSSNYSLLVPANTSLTVQVGYHGSGNTNTDPTGGRCTGGFGGLSYITISTLYDISFNAFGGSPGGGLGLTQRSGNGGNVSYSTTATGDYSTIGGGGCGGGGACSDNINARFGGLGGSFTYKGTTSAARKGEDGGAGRYAPGNYFAGNGGSIDTNIRNYDNITVPFKYNTITVNNNATFVYCSNGGAGGTLKVSDPSPNGNFGGGAGGTNGKGGIATAGSPSASGVTAFKGYKSTDNTFYYGNGGGGAAQPANSQQTLPPTPVLTNGGNGSPGVVMLWWNY